MTTKLYDETQRIMALHPHLHVNGYGGVFDDSDRAMLLTHEAQVLIAAGGIWISCSLAKAVKVNHNATLGKLRATMELVSNGPLTDGLVITTMLIMGFDAESLSCRPAFNITQQSLDAAISAQRPKRCQTGKRVELVQFAKGNAGDNRTALAIAKRFQRAMFARGEGKDN